MRNQPEGPLEVLAKEMSPEIQDLRNVFFRIWVIFLARVFYPIEGLG